MRVQSVMTGSLAAVVRSTVGVTWMRFARRTPVLVHGYVLQAGMAQIVRQVADALEL